MSDIIRKIDLRVKLETIECTSTFFGQYEFPSKYSIIKIKENIFGIVNNETNVCKITFKKIVKLYKDRYVYLITTTENTNLLVKYIYGEEFCSDNFRQIVKLFHRYALIEDFNNQRFLVSTEPDNVDITFKEWFKNSTKDWSQIELFREDDKGEIFNYKNTIILKDGLKFLDFGFYSIIKQYSDKFLEVSLDTCSKRMIIDITTLKIYTEYFQYIAEHIKGADGKIYVIVHSSNGQFILRLNDYKDIECRYSKINFLSNKYAECFDGKDRCIIRLSDFKEARFY